MSARDPSHPLPPGDPGATPGQRGELVLYPTEDGSARFYLRAEHGTVWLSQAELAELFQTSVPNINIHIKNVLAEGELQGEATIKDDLIVRTEGGRQVRRPLKLYNLDMILAVGYRVKSPRGTQFRQWATTRLRNTWSRASHGRRAAEESRRSGTTSTSCWNASATSARRRSASTRRSATFTRLSWTTATTPPQPASSSPSVQNKMLFAVTQQTAAEIVFMRADPSQPNMALTSWKASRVRKTDVIVAKNYLAAAEVEELNRIAAMFLDYAEDRARKRQDIRMADWRQYVDNFIAFNERPLLKGAGRISHGRMQQVAHERYAEFDAKRRLAEALAADVEDIKELEAVEKRGRKGGKDAS